MISEELVSAATSTTTSTVAAAAAIQTTTQQSLTFNSILTSLSLKTTTTAAAIALSKATSTFLSWSSSSSTTNTTTTTSTTTTVATQSCSRLTPQDLFYQSGEQYLILCLKLCNLIIKSKCNINDLVDQNQQQQQQQRYYLIQQQYNNQSLTNTTNQTSIIKNYHNFGSPELINNNNYNIEHNTPLLQHLNTFDYSSYHNYYYYSKTTSNNLTTSPYASPTMLLLSHLNETECIKYGYRESYKLSLFIFGIILSFIILTLNSLTLITIIRTRRLHTITNILIANLSISDFLSGLSFLYPCILNLLTINALETYNSYLYELACNIRQYYYLCLVAYSPMITSMLSSIFTLTLIALEKYIAILKPYLYERLINKRKILPLCIFVNWTLAIIISLLPIMGWNGYNKQSLSYRGFSCTNPQSMPCMFERIFTLDYILLFTSICGLCAIMMLAIYIRIYLIARKHSKQIAQITHLVKKNQQQQQQQLEQQQQQQQDIENVVVVERKQQDTSYLDFEMITLQTDTNNNTNNNDNDNSTCNCTTTSSSHHHLNKTLHTSPTLNTYLDLYCTESTNLQQTTNIDEAINNSRPSKYTLTTPATPTTSTSSSSSSSSTSSPSLTSKQRSQTIVKTTTTITNGTKTTTIKSTQSIITTKSLNLSMKAMKTLLILLMGFYMCWLPLIVYFLTFATQKYNNLTIYILMFVACCNAVIDPIVYAFRNRDFYKALLLNFKVKLLTY